MANELGLDTMDLYEQGKFKEADSFINKKERYLKLVNDILLLKEQTGENLFHIGWKLKIIREENLFLVEFKDWKEFLYKRIGMSLTTATDLIAVVKEFNLNEFKEYGFTKLIEFKKIKEPTERSVVMKNTPPSIGVRNVEKIVTEYQFQKGIKATRDALNLTKPEREPSIKAEEERTLKLKREGIILSEQASELIELKAIWKDKFLKWCNIANNFNDKNIVALKQELIKKDDLIR